MGGLLLSSTEGLGVGVWVLTVVEEMLSSHLGWAVEGVGSEENGGATGEVLGVFGVSGLAYLALGRYEERDSEPNTACMAS